MSTLSHMLAVASVLLASACTTQVGGGDSLVDDGERADLAGVDAGAQPDALVVSAGPCGEEGSDADFTSVDGTCYEYFFQGSSWAGAKLKCQILGGELAHIDNDVTNGILASLVPTAFPTAWLGATDESSEGAWTWDGAAMSFTNWRAGEPNNGAGGAAENCMIIESDRGGTWDDRNCSDTTSYICQR